MASTEEISKNNETPAKAKDKYPLVKIRGVPFHAVLQQGVENILEWIPNPGDIFIVTYPKCGTTWTQYVVWGILNKGDPPPHPNKMMISHMPFLEVTGTDGLDELPKPRTMKTHLPFQLQPYHPSAKYIYVTRNPMDCCVSYYYHNKQQMTELSFEEHFEMFLKGHVSFGDFFEHALSWYKHRNDPNVLFLTYEDMKRNPRKYVLEIAKFLGDEYYEVLISDDEVLENCIKHSSFEYMKGMGFYVAKEDKSVDKPSLKEFLQRMKIFDENNIDSEAFRPMEFFRKGVVGDWRNHFTQPQIEAFGEYMSRKLHKTNMENFWGPITEETSL